MSSIDFSLADKKIRSEYQTKGVSALSEYFILRRQETHNAMLSRISEIELAELRGAVHAYDSVLNLVNSITKTER